MIPLSTIPKFIGYKLANKNLMKPPMPYQITFSVTTACQSLCKSCNIGLEYQKNPSAVKNDLTIEEIEKMFKSIGPVYFFNVSGGEPYLRMDLPKIIELACKYLKPRVIHTPTNALMPEIIERKTREIMEIINKYDPSVPYTIKPSFDGYGKRHDELRGVQGNFEKLNETYKRLKNLQKDFPNLHVGLGTVISKNNLDVIKETVDYALSLEPDTYINEVAEERSEMFNDSSITPTAEEYKKATDYFSYAVAKKLGNNKGLSRITQAFRLVYYDLTVDILKTKSQVIPCYAGTISAHINAQGQVWACSILAYDKPLGNVRDYGCDFYKVWYSDQAEKVRQSIRRKECACPMANASYYNMMLHTPSVFKAIKYYFFPNSYKRDNSLEKEANKTKIDIPVKASN